MANRSICKFFVNGACFKGEHCQFSHDWNDQPNDVCTFYQNGVCSYGSRCRYEHAEVSFEYPPPSTTAALAPSNSSQISGSNGCPLCERHPDVIIQAQEMQRSGLAYVHRPGSRFDHEDYIQEDGNSLSSTLTAQNQAPHPLAHLPICSSAAAGTCPYGKGCPQIHGDLCTTCGKQCLHPYRPSERGAHIKLCKRNSNRLETLKKSEEIECSVCLDRVLSKHTAAEKRFGLLPECDHAFCITCIRKWRSSSVTSAMDIDSTVKACPICRKVSYYVIPSATWYSSKEEKQDIIDGYKAKLKSIDCRYFDFGRDTCPFGGRCFYKHAYTDGSLEEPAPVAVIHFHASDGSLDRTRNFGLVLYWSYHANLNIWFLIEILVTFQVGILAQPVTSVGKTSNHQIKNIKKEGAQKKVLRGTMTLFSSWWFRRIIHRNLQKSYKSTVNPRTAEKMACL